MSDGWIKLYRGVTDCWFWKEEPFSFGQAWIDILLRANHEEKKVPIGNEIVTVPAGAFITSELKLMNAWGWGKAKTRRFLKLLENDDMIAKKTDHKKTTIFIVNWGKYQICNTKSRPIADQSQTDSRPIADTNKNIKNDKNEKNIYEEAVDYINTPRARAATAPDERYYSDPLRPLSAEQLAEIIRTWNSQTCVIKLEKIPFGGANYNNTLLSVGNDWEGYLKTIMSIDRQAFFQKRRDQGKPVTYKWFCQPDNYQSVRDGNYLKKWQEEHKETEQERSIRKIMEAKEE